MYFVRSCVILSISIKEIHVWYYSKITAFTFINVLLLLNLIAISKIIMKFIEVLYIKKIMEEELY